MGKISSSRSLIREKDRKRDLQTFIYHIYQNQRASSHRDDLLNWWGAFKPTLGNSLLISFPLLYKFLFYHFRDSLFSSFWSFSWTPYRIMRILQSSYNSTQQLVWKVCQLMTLINYTGISQTILQSLISNLPVDPVCVSVQTLCFLHFQRRNKYHRVQGDCNAAAKDHLNSII